MPNGEIRKEKGKATAHGVMNSRLAIEECWSVIGITATTLLLLTAIFATDAMSQEREELSVMRISTLGYFEPIDGTIVTEVDEQSPFSVVDEHSPISEEIEPNRSLEIKLRALNPTTCIGTSLWMEVEIINTSLDPIRIGKDGVWASLSYKLYRTDSDEVRLGATYFSGTSLDYFVLGGGESYRDTYEISLKGKLFFRKPDKFALMTRIETVSSNEVTFELCDCGNTIEEVK